MGEVGFPRGTFNPAGLSRRKERLRSNFLSSLAPAGRGQGEGEENTVVIFEPFLRVAPPA